MIAIARENLDVADLTRRLSWLDLATTTQVVTGSKKRRAVDPSRLTLRNACIPAKNNDPCAMLRARYTEAAFQVSSPLHLPPQMPECPCLDLRGFSFWAFPHDLINRAPDAVFIDISHSRIRGFPDELFGLPVKTFLMAGCSRKLGVSVVRFFSSGKLKSAKSTTMQRTLEILDVSKVRMDSSTISSIMTCFPLLSKVMLSSCDLSEFPFSLEANRMFLKVVDLSHNRITHLPNSVWNRATRGAFDPSYPEVSISSGRLSLADGLRLGYVYEAHTQEVFGAIPTDGDGNPLHIDLRGNPLDENTQAILSRFTSVQISGSHQIVFLPENCFIYADLPRAPMHVVLV